MEESQWEQLSREELFQLESICDQFELDQRRCLASTLLQPSSYIEQLSGKLKEIAYLEMKRIQLELASEKAQLEERSVDVVDSYSTDPFEQRPRVHPSPEFKRFALEERLGQGSTGTVWKAFDTRLKRFVALKVPHHPSENTAKTYLREAQAASRLNHPNIVRILEVGQEEEGCFLLSEWMEGESLAKRTERQPATIEDAIEWMIEVCEGLDYAHSMGVVHRDLKPQNILLDPSGRLKILDFGMAKTLQDTELTQTNSGAILGTPAYMSPEQAAGCGSEHGVASDIYSCGVILFQWMTGELPFRGKAQSVLYQVLYTEPPVPSQLNRDISKELETICLKCLEKDPRDRYPSARALQDELKRVRDGAPIQAKPTSEWRKAKRWAVQNPKVAALAAICALLLLLVSITASVSSIVITRSWQRESELRQLAQQEVRESEEMLHFFETIFRGAEVTNLLLTGSGNPTGPTSIPALLDLALERLEVELPSQPLTQAKLLDVIANAYRGSGEFEKASELLEQAETIRREVASTHGSHEPVTYDNVLHTYYLAWLEHDRSHWEEAEKLYRKAIESSQQFGNDRMQELDRSDILFQLSRLLLERNRKKETVPLLAECRRLREKHLPKSSPQFIAVRAASALSEDGELMMDKVLEVFNHEDWTTNIVRQYVAYKFHASQKNYGPACTCYDSVIGQLRTAFPGKHPVVALALGEFAGLLFDAGEYRRAYEVATEAIQIGNERCPTHEKLLDAKSKLATELVCAGRFQEASRMCEEVCGIQDKNGQFSERATMALFQSMMAMDRFKEANALAARLWEKGDKSSPHQKAWLAYQYARSLRQCGYDEQAVELDQIACGELKSLWVSSLNAAWLEQMALILLDAGRVEEAEKFLRQAVQLERNARPPQHPKIADRIASLVEILIKQDKNIEALELLNESIEIRKQKLPAGDKRIDSDESRLKHLTNRLE